MIRLYYLPSPNGRKVSIALEEMSLPYEIVMVNIFEYEAQTPAYLAICPNGRIPAIVDDLADGTHVKVFESGAILQYLGRKSGLFYPITAEAKRAWVDAWVFWQMAGLGPMAGQITWFRRAAAKPGRDPAETSLALHRFTKEVKRLYGVLERQLEGREYICDEYSIADMACWPWVEQYGSYVDNLSALPATRAWHARLAMRPAIQRAMKVGVGEIEVPSV
jgi:GSH-dependent disulfide-bond oxidoreductase